MGEASKPVLDEIETLGVVGNSSVIMLLEGIDRLFRFRPPRLLAKYSQTIPRFAQRAQVGLSLLHLSLDAAHPLQLSRNFGAAGTVGWRWVLLGEFDAAIGDGFCVFKVDG